MIVEFKVLEKALSRLPEMSKKWTGGVCAGELWHMDGSEFVSGHGACHSWLTTGFDLSCLVERRGYGYRAYRPYKTNAENFLTLTCHGKRSGSSPGATKGVLVWLAEKSVMKDFIVGYNDYGAVILCGPGGANEQQAMWICKVLRYSTEGGKALDVWWQLYQGGVDGMLAIIVASFVRTVAGATFGYTGTDGHSTVFFDQSCNISQALRGEFNPKPTCTYDLFANNPENLGLENKLRAMTKRALRDDGWGGKVVGQARDSAEFIAAIKEWQVSTQAATKE